MGRIIRGLATIALVMILLVKFLPGIKTEIRTPIEVGDVWIYQYEEDNPFEKNCDKVTVLEVKEKYVRYRREYLSRIHEAPRTLEASDTESYFRVNSHKAKDGERCYWEKTE